MIEPEGSSRPPSPDAGPIPEVDHYELDGIPLYHLPMAGPTVLMLAFRVGRADEPPIRGGMTHLAEHLVMHAAVGVLDHSNGITEPLRVWFTVRGTPEQASAFLREICNAIETPRLRRMHEEINVLRAEAAARSGSSFSLRMTWLRTGFQGIGTVYLPELFLRAPDERILEQWIADHFVAGNAVIGIAGTLPDDLFVSLPPGSRTPLPATEWIPGFEGPTVLIQESPGIAASFYMERSIASSEALRAIDRHLRKALRVDRGLGYDVGSDVVPTSPDHALATVWAGCLPAAVADVQRVMLETIDDVAARGPTDEELARRYDEVVQDALDPMMIPGRLDAFLRDVLLGREPEPIADRLETQWRLDSATVATAFRRARDSLLLLLPANAQRPQRPFKPYPGSTRAAMGQGRAFEAVGTKQSLPWSKARTVSLTVGENGVSIDAASGFRFLGVLWADAVAVMQAPNGRMVVGRDGMTVNILDHQWRDGSQALRLVDRLAPRHLIVPPGG